MTILLGLIAAISVAGAQLQSTSSRVVLVSTTVSGRALVDLGVDDFVVEEDGKSREILDVHIADYPLVVLLDNAAADIDAVRDAAIRFVSKIGERGVAVGTLAEPSGLIATFDDDRARVLAAIRDAPAAPAARLAPSDALATAARMLKESGAPFSAIVVISARPLAPTELGPADLLTPVLGSGTAVHVVARRPGVSEPDPSAQGAPDLFRELANVSHGQYTTIYSAASYAIALDRLADRLAAEMMIQYLSPPGGSAGGEVRVGVKIPGAKVTGLGVSR